MNAEQARNITMDAKKKDAEIYASEFEYRKQVVIAEITKAAAAKQFSCAISDRYLRGTDQDLNWLKNQGYTCDLSLDYIFISWDAVEKKKNWWFKIWE